MAMSRAKQSVSSSTKARLASIDHQEQAAKAAERLRRAQERAKTFKLTERGHNDALLEGVVLEIDHKTGMLTVQFDPITSPCVIEKKTPPPKGEKVKISALLFHHADELGLHEKVDFAFVESRRSRRDL